jgi:hypothetical protein
MTRMPPVENLCYYKIQKSDEAAFMALLAKHWPTLHAAGLATDEPARVLKAVDRAGNLVIIEFFAWKDASGPGVAHQTPEIMQVWEPMGAFTKGNMEFWATEPVTMGYQQ